ncbi:MAG: sugar phosphate isomerase/epimerase [Armatimonadetes bacterium]|nr:sugar phosphate isomerase/epimerase [Armatimonadota bacterium]
MRLGVCAGIEHAGDIREAGFDYIELPLSSTLRPLEPESEILVTLRKISTLPIPVESYNVFLPGDVKVTGPETDFELQRRYLAAAFRRASQTGAEVIVFGSAGARNLPPGWSRTRGEQQISDFLSLSSRYAEKYRIKFALEPLQLAESNIINTVSEAYRMVQPISSPWVGVLADLYHMESDGEPISHIENAVDRLLHVHTADSGRLAPGTGRYPNQALIQTLKEIGYDARISVECQWRNFVEEPKLSLHTLRSFVENPI